jgi:predicted ATPase/class 3 adenylate cyclase
MVDAPARLPTGTVTFLFTDVEGSTRVLRELGADRYAEVLAAHRRELRAIFARHGGTEIDTQGDAFFVAFDRATDAVAAADEARGELAEGLLICRVGLHTGEPTLTPDGYVGMDVHRAARIAAAAHGGQAVLSQTTRGLLADDIVVRDLGRHRLKDMAHPLRLYQLGEDDHPPLRSLAWAHLPAQPTPLVGREHELQEISDLVKEHRLVTLTGPAGSGKTRLAVEFAAEAAGSFSDGVFWVPLHALREPDLVLPTMGQVVGAQNGVADHLRSARALLVLDNLEQLLPAALQLSELLRLAPGVKLVVTSREPLHIRAEREYRVAPLAEDEAVALFVARAQAVERGFEHSDAVVEICRRLDCLPLAVELAAARVRVLSPDAILARLDRRLQLLTGGPRDVPAKQRGLRAALDWSYELLSDPERRIFGRCSVFAGSWTLDTAEAMWDADVDTLHALTDKSLVRVETDRFSMLETVREYASERLEESDEAQQVRERHAETFALLAERARAELGGSRHAEWNARLQVELPNIRAALVWAEEHRPELLHRIAASLRAFWNTHGHLREGRSWLERSLRAGAEGSQRAEVLGGLGWICRAMGDRDGALLAAEERLQLARGLDDAKNVSGALGLLAVLAEESKDIERAEQLHQECISISVAQGGQGRPERHRGNYAEFLLRQHRFDEAGTMLGECRAAAGTRGDTFLVGRYTSDLGALALLDGRAADALPLLAEGVRLLHELGERYGTLYCLPLLAESLSAVGSHEAGARLVGATQTLLETIELALWSEGVRRLEGTIASLRDALGDARFEAVRIEGAALSFDDAIDYALAEAGAFAGETHAGSQTPIGGHGPPVGGREAADSLQ